MLICRCAERLNTIPHTFWADYAFPAPRYGQRTSNLVEQQNFVYLQAREMPVLDMFMHIWKDVQNKVFNRHRISATAALTSNFSNHINKMYHHDNRSSQVYEAQPASPLLGVVHSIRDPNLEFKVCLQRSNWSCTCGEFQNNLRPCPHAFALIHHLGLAPIDYIAPFHTSSAWRQTYVLFLNPILRSELSETDILPPDLKRRRGRPRKKRMDQFRQGLQEEFVAEDVGSQNASQQAEEVLELREDSSEAEGGIESWDGEMGDGKSIAAEDQAEENGRTVLGGNSTVGMSKRPPKHSWEWVLEPVEQPATVVTVSSRTRSGRL
jgi:hypothetical protein